METEVLFKNGQESPRRSSRRDSLSLTQLLGMPTTEVKEVTVEVRWKMFFTTSIIDKYSTQCKHIS